MSRSVLASVMLASVREQTDTQNDTHLTDAEIYKFLSSSVADTWDKIQSAGLGGEAVKTVYFSTVTGQQDYDLTAAIWKPTVGGAGAPLTDFYAVRTLYVNDGNGLYRPVQRTTPSEEYALRAATSVMQMKLCYIPVAPVFVTGAETFDGINGWEEHAVQLACIKVKKKKNDDWSPYRRTADEIEMRIARHANKNQDEPPRIIRRRAASKWAARTLPYTGGIGAWDLRGNMIELYQPSYGLYL